MSPILPGSSDEVARTLRDAASNRSPITLIGNNSKKLMAGPMPVSQVLVSTKRLRRVLQYEQADLTVSVEAGMPFSELQSMLAKHGQMIALDPPFLSQSTIGGVVASNSSGPLRRAFGTARDLVIGMTFATLHGKLVETGGRVVKNVAGLDMGKLMIGSFGTLAAIVSLNLRVHSSPADTRTFLLTFTDLDSATRRRDAILAGVLQPFAIDLLSPAAAARFGSRGFLLALRVGGSRPVIKRYADVIKDAEQIGGDQELSFWNAVREFTPDFLRRQPDGIVVRVSSNLSQIASLMKLVPDPCISRAGSGVTYVYLTSWQGFSRMRQTAINHNWSAVVEFAPEEVRLKNELWLQSQAAGAAEAFAMMKRVKHLFDPDNLLNRSRLYGRL